MSDRRNKLAFAIFALVAAGFFSGSSYAETSLPLTTQTGPYAVTMEMDPTLPDHTIFRPRDLSKVSAPLPVIAFGNGGCANVGNTHQQLLAEIASHGYIVVAGGPIDPALARGGAVTFGGGQDTTAQMIKTLDWATSEAGSRGSPYFGKIATDKFAVSGQSCGGLQAIAAGADPRVKTVVILNSGIIRGRLGGPGPARPPAAAPAGGPPGGPPRVVGGPPQKMMMPATEADLAKLHTPLIYLTGGPTDIAYAGAEGDFKAINGLPIFDASTDKGHGGTWFQLDGGFMAKPVVAWLDWQLKGDTAASKQFLGADCGLCTDPRWTVKKKNLP